MAQEVKPYNEEDSSKKEQVTKMFDTISGEYDGLNRMISLGLDQKWRANVVDMIAATNPDTIMDIATGTGDLVIQMAQKTNASKLIGLDISSGMLEVGKIKVKKEDLDNRIEMVLGDSEDLPFENDSIDAVTVSYGVRNFEDLEKGLSEIRRVLKPQGILVILETSVPTKFPFKQGYYVFSKLVVPTIGKLFSKDKIAYGYLQKSASTFPYGERFNNILKKVGFNNVEHFLQFHGASTIYKAIK
ncbi:MULTISPECIES: bifunctional demethylmenaquinone methyltransferase/2-methoxy-6-polyprenyl-1,4-benzoquinol methylase UbiE [Nonlabens]|uniref:Demethylmenaquinone methyltransferase n=3 Tax=Nonlabens ulvanivorans TaxID=906888 RepID=A0A084JV75_NONUL|nr:bifunctional demethylmenaquinone methyltransferase/2-methoxy-6-polyprenyl-1,4-benzoquinol methylase UbiE [Nonlabens ulvanivorans]KEZ92859.1 ubiquinone biosynthesis methyltransferase UbiE [Nonlabens ulvanivorans]PRX15714.1 demethylmenaquinone methyltransferase/2-methoxy-6-polyprenyl-1,4-benzoquinol methylase [Nonlabens ulvanivorans]WOI21949.1 bifunctional demethylmenaquinone methyltransferase/2-methoxy-6-polyprenyl-1,4-benzoquinol methylase UbiE [Nonlabens ulvanivorans]GAL76454.1 2-heptapreny